MGDPILARLIADQAQRQPDLDVLTFVDADADAYREEVRTYAGLWRCGQSLAGGLRREGMLPGEAFALVMHNHPEFVDAMVAASITGTVFVPLDPRMAPQRLAYMLRFAGCRGVVAADYALAAVDAALEQSPAVEWVWVLGDAPAGAHCSGRRSRTVADVLADAGPELAIGASDPAEPMQLLFTSGTTGPPKAIAAPHARFGAVAKMGATLGFRTEDRPYTGLSLTHANAQFLTLGNALHMGMRAVFSRRFTRSRLWDITRRYQCSVFNLLGGMTTALLAVPERPDDRDNPVRYVLSAGTPAAAWNVFRARFGVEIFEFYGTAEGGMLLNPPGAGPVGSVGKPPADLTCAVLDENDDLCPPGAPGDICFRAADGSGLDLTYFRDPDASAVKTRGGWLRTGDVGHTDAAGWFYFDYRRGEGIRRNGEFVDPALVERVMAGISGVADVFVYGIALPECAPGEKALVAAVEPDDRFDAAAVFADCARHLPGNLVPDYLQRVERIPKTASEKPQAGVLRDAFAARPQDIVARL